MEPLGHSVRSIYRRMLKLAHRLPAADRSHAVQSIRTAFRAHASENSQEKVAELLATANSKLSYLKVVTPREVGDDLGNAGVSRYVLHDGKLVAAGSAGGTISAGGTADLRPCVDPDLLARHERGLRRFRFMDRS
jgi:hypothetical protein